MTVVAVLLAGGTGTRLYPASRSDRPKQFLSFGAEDSLLRQTADRAAFADELVVVTRDAFAEACREHVPEAAVLVEPQPRDTGPAMVFAAHECRDRFGEDCVLLCLPADHHVEGDFETTARAACDVAVETGGLVTIGIEPDRPATGYGYIEPTDAATPDAPGSGTATEDPATAEPADAESATGDATDGALPGGASPVASFREKPDADTAVDLVAAGCLWNAGMFAWTPDALLDAARDSPLEPVVSALEAGRPDRGFAAVDPVSVDYAVMERTGRAYVVPAGFEWDDLGAWDAIARLTDPDAAGNAAVGDALTLDASGNVLASDDKHVTVVGADDLVVAAYDDRVLVVPKADAQRVRDVVSALRETGEF